MDSTVKANPSGNGVVQEGAAALQRTDGRSAGYKDTSARGKGGGSPPQVNPALRLDLEGVGQGLSGDLVLNGSVPDQPPKDAALEEEDAKIGNLPYSQLYQRYTDLQAEVKMLRRQLEKKEEQRITAIKLLKKAKKRHDEERDKKEMMSASTARGLSLSLISPRVDRPDSPTGSIGGSSIFSQSSAVCKRGGQRRVPSLGLKELIDPNHRLAAVLDKLASEPVLTILENFVGKTHIEGPKSARYYSQHSLSTIHSRKLPRMFPIAADLISTGSPTSQAPPSKREG